MARVDEKDMAGYVSLTEIGKYRPFMAGAFIAEADREAVVLMGDPQNIPAQSDCGGFKMG